MLDLEEGVKTNQHVRSKGCRSKRRNTAGSVPFMPCGGRSSTFGGVGAKPNHLGVMLVTTAALPGVLVWYPLVVSWIFSLMVSSSSIAFHHSLRELESFPFRHATSLASIVQLETSSAGTSSGGDHSLSTLKTTQGSMWALYSLALCPICVQFAQLTTPLILLRPSFHARKLKHLTWNGL